MNKKDLTQTKRHYQMIQNSYIGRYKEMHDKIIALEKEIINLKHQVELKDKDFELQKQKTEILELKLQLALNK